MTPSSPSAARFAVLPLLLVLLLAPSRAAAQGPIGSGETLVGSISPSGDSDSWTFTATAGEAIVVRTGEISESGAFTMRLRLYDPGAAQVGVTSFSATGAEVAVVAPSTGTYTALVDNGNAGVATCTYRISLAKTGGAVSVSPGDEGGPLTNGAMHTGVIEVGDLDVWTVSANANDAIVVRMGETTPGSLTSYLRIYSPAGALMDVSESPAGAEIDVRANSSGTYLVVAGDFTTNFAGSGGYRLTLATTGAPVTVSSGDEGGAMTNGAMHTGTIEVGDLDVWTIPVVAGDGIVVRMAETAAGSPLTSQLRIYDPAGLRVDISNSAVGAEVEIRAALTGTYLVVASDFTTNFQGAGDYRLSLATTGAPVTVSPGDEGGAMTNGAMHTGTIEVGDLDVWTIPVVAGDGIVVRMAETASGSSLTSQLRIFDPAGLRVDISNSAVGAEVEIRAALTGTYLVVANDFTTNFQGAGDYRLTLARTGAPVTVSPGDEGGPMTNGAMHTGTIEVGDLDAWTIDANAGEAIVVRMGESVSGSPLTAELRIFDPAGLRVDFSSSVVGAEVEITAGLTGTYLLVASDFTTNFAGAGTYRMTLAKTGSPVTVSPGDEGGPLTGSVVAGTIDVGDLDVYTISATSGQTILARMDELAPGSLTPQLRLYSPSGTRIGISSSATFAQIAVVAPATGTYVLVASDFSTNFAGSGRYTVAPTNTVDTPSGPAPLELALGAAFPNPSAGRTSFRFRLPGAAPASIRVYDAQGRLVRTLLDEPSLPAGEHEAAWDGRDLAGRKARPGVYLARMESAGRAMVRKLTLAE